MMDGTYRCENCGKNEQAYKCLHLDEATTIVCADCYYKAQELTGENPWTLEDVKEGHISEESLKKKRNDYLSTIRRHTIHYQKDIKAVTKHFLEKEIELSPLVCGNLRKDLKPTQINKLTTYLREISIKEYFGRLLSVKELKEIVLNDYYTHRDYELKLRTMLR